MRVEGLGLGDTGESNVGGYQNMGWALRECRDIWRYVGLRA